MVSSITAYLHNLSSASPQQLQAPVFKWSNTAMKIWQNIWNMVLHCLEKANRANLSKTVSGAPASCPHQGPLLYTCAFYTISSKQIDQTLCCIMHIFCIMHMLCTSNIAAGTVIPVSCDANLYPRGWLPAIDGPPLITKIRNWMSPSKDGCLRMFDALAQTQNCNLHVD